MNNIYELLADTTTFIIGSEKNAGKTTFLNYALAEMRKNGISPAFLTIGVDGEKQDLIFGNPKPQIYSEAGDYLVTTAAMSEKSDALFEIHAVFPVQTVLGRLVLVKTQRGGYIELVGPEANAQLAAIIDFLRSEKQITTIVVDGAVNRITQVAAGQKAGFIYVLQVTQNNMRRALEKMRTLSLLNNFPQVEKQAIDQPECFLFSGALTKNKLVQIPEKCRKLVIEDFTKIFLSYSEVQKLCQRMEVFFRETYFFHFFVVNLYNIKQDEFMKTLKRYYITDKIIFNPYQI